MADGEVCELGAEGCEGGEEGGGVDLRTVLDTQFV